MHNLVLLRRFLLRKMLVDLLKTDFYFCLYTGFYVFLLEVQTHPNFSLSFLKVILLLEN